MCHVYIDKLACMDMARSLILDAKIDYPIACNGMVSNHNAFYLFNMALAFSTLARIEEYAYCYWNKPISISWHHTLT